VNQNELRRDLVGYWNRLANLGQLATWSPHLFAERQAAIIPKSPKSA